MRSSDSRLRKVVHLALEPGRPARRMTLGNALANGLQLEQVGALRSAEALFRELSRQVPNAEPARGLLAESLLKQQLPLRAQRAIAPILEKAVDPGTLIVGSRIARRMLRFEEGRALAEKATRIDPKRVDSLFELASCEMELGHREQAAELLGRVIRKAPRLAAAYWQRAQLDLEEHDSEHLTEIEALLESGTFPERERVFLHFACARILQRRGDVDAEFRHLDAANAVVARDRPWDPAAAWQRHERIRKYVEDGRAADLDDTERQDEPTPILIASMPRSGSTLVESILGAHADVTPCGECGLFSNAAAERLRDLDARSLDDLWTGTQTLADQVDAIAVHASTFIDALQLETPRFTEKGIANFDYLPFLLLAFPRAKAIHVLRHPLDAALSAYQLHFSEGHGYAYDLRAFAVRYQQHLEIMDAWRRLFRDRIATVRYEELVQHPEPVVRSLLAFCELPWDERCLRFHENREAAPTASFLQVRRPLHASSVERFRRYGPHLAPAAEQLGIDLSK